MINKQYGNTDNFHDNSSLAVAECAIQINTMSTSKSHKNSIHITNYLGKPQVELFVRDLIKRKM